jgi:hypothetical protein
MSAEPPISSFSVLRPTWGITFLEFVVGLSGLEPATPMIAFRQFHTNAYPNPSESLIAHISRNYAAL